MSLPSRPLSPQQVLHLERGGGGRLLSVAALDLSQHWRGTRHYASSMSQLKLAMSTLIEVMGPSRSPTVEEVTIEQLKACVHLWRGAGLSHETINKRVNTLSALGIACPGVRLPRPSRLRWQQAPERLEPLLAYLRANPPPFPRAKLMADYVEWVCFTGTRVEEVLRMTWDDVRLDIREEPGKASLVSYSEMRYTTQGAQATLAISLRPALLLQRRFAQRAGADPRVFPINYECLTRDWVHPRSFLGAMDNKQATLKALRRYGCYNTNEQRGWL
jgi:integrase